MLKLWLKDRGVQIALAIVVVVLAVWAWQSYQHGKNLAISEWGVTLPVSSTIKGATYHLNGDQSVAFLSTQGLDNSQACQNFYQHQQGASYYYPSYQFIVRLAPGDQTVPTDGSGTMSAKVAAQKYPDIYKAIGKYVYQYGKGRGVPCSAQTKDMTNSFYAAFTKMR